MQNLYDQGLLKPTDEPGKVVTVESYEEFQHQRQMKELESQSQQTEQI